MKISVDQSASIAERRNQQLELTEKQLNFEFPQLGPTPARSKDNSNHTATTSDPRLKLERQQGRVRKLVGDQSGELRLTTRGCS